SFRLLRPAPLSSLLPYTTLFRSTYLHHQPSQARDAGLLYIRLLGPWRPTLGAVALRRYFTGASSDRGAVGVHPPPLVAVGGQNQDRKSTRLNSSHGSIYYAVFCL